MVELYDYQKEALTRMRDGSILCGKVGSGKSLTGLTYYLENHKDKPLYIITIAKKRDDKEWQDDLTLLGIDGVVDSWNNINKYIDIQDCFFIFDEQRAVGTGSWGKAFVKIARRNKWIMLTGTPGDVWMDYISVFLAHEFFKNKSHFIDRHVEYKPFSNFPQIKRYHYVEELERYRRRIIVPMRDTRTTQIHKVYVNCSHDKEFYNSVIKERMNPYTGQPIMNASEFTQVIRRIVNESPRRIENAKIHIESNPRIIVFYNYMYELDILKQLCFDLGREYYQWNGRKHEPIPDKDEWVYLVQYTAGAEGWNCITTDVELFYSLNYSYRIMEQSEGRINRVNTPYEELHYFYLKTPDTIDDAIQRSIKRKGKFNERNWARQFEYE